MGAGKTAAGKHVARQIGWNFVDLDAEIVCAAGKSIADVFEESGEARFRDMEHAALKEALQRQQIILALGGGAIESAENRRLLFKGRRTLLIYLEAPLEVLFARCAEQREADQNAPSRPVLEDREELHTRFLRRKPLYELAHVTIPTADRGLEEVVEKIMEEWKRRAHFEEAR